MSQQLSEMSIGERLELIANPEKLRETVRKLDEEKAVSEPSEEKVEKKRKLTPKEQLISVLSDNLKKQFQTDAAMGGENREGTLESIVGKDPTDFVTTWVESLGMQDIVGIQPMSAPINLVYSLQYKHEDCENLDGTSGKKLNLEVVSSAVEAATSRAHCRWTIEPLQGLKTHGFDLEEEMRTAVALELAFEHTDEIIQDLTQLADEEDEYDFASDNTVTTGDKAGEMRIEHSDLAIGCTINKMASRIACKTRRGAGNWMIVHPEVAHYLSTIPRLNYKRVNSTSESKYGPITLCGVLHDHIKVYGYMNQPIDKILMGYKGSSATDTGYIFSPYMIALSGGVVVDPDTFEPSVTMYTRYARMPLPNGKDYFGVINLKNIPWLTEVPEDLPINNAGLIKSEEEYEVANDHLRHEENVEALLSDIFDVDLSDVPNEIKFDDAMKILGD